MVMLVYLPPIDGDFGTGLSLGFPHKKWGLYAKSGTGPGKGRELLGLVFRINRRINANIGGLVN